EVHDDDADLQAAQRASARDDGVRATLLLLGLLQALGVRLSVLELQKVDRPDVAGPALQGSGVGQHVQARVDRHAVVVPALGAHVQVGYEVLAVDLSVTFVALQPQTRRAVVVFLAGRTVASEQAFKRHLASRPKGKQWAAWARASVAVDYFSCRLGASVAQPDGRG